MTSPFSGQFPAVPAAGLDGSGYSNGQVPTWSLTSKLWVPGSGGGSGTHWWTGSGAPGTVVGAVGGDYYINTTNGEVYELVSGTWTDQSFSLQGATGSAGATGAAGANGTNTQGVPPLNGLLLQTFDPTLTDLSTFAPTSGRAYFFKVYAPSALTITNIVVMFGTQGSALTYARAAIFNSAGTMLSITADQSTDWATAGSINIARTCPVQPTAGGSATPYSWAGGSGSNAYFYISFLTVGTTSPAWVDKTGANTSLTNVNTSLAAGNFVASFQTLATLNGPVTWTAGALATNFWMGVS